MKKPLLLTSVALIVSGCSIIDAMKIPDYGTDWKKIDQLKLADFKASNGYHSLFLELNEVGKWPAGQKVVFIEPSDCTYQRGQGEAFYFRCKWMAEITDIRGTQLCVDVDAWRNYNGSLGYQTSALNCRWKDEVGV